LLLLAKRCTLCKLILIIVFSFLLTNAVAFADDETPQQKEAAVNVDASDNIFYVGEELTYEVSYSIFTLGTIKIQVLDKTVKNGRPIYRAKAFIDSHTKIPFVNIHYVFYSEDDTDLYSHYFSGMDTKDPKNTYYSDYDFRYDLDRVFYRTGVRQTQSIFKKGEDTLWMPTQDGLSLFYYARGHVHQQSIVDVPTYVDEKLVNTHINFLNKKSTVTINAVKYPVRAVELDGNADFVGIFGMTGAFHGWFSDDAAAIPIVATMKVILGSVHIELIKWNRPGWNPPSAN
jgi:hypothetical protein